MLSDHATTIAQAYGAGSPASEMIMVARGEQGCVWRIDTDTGARAIKELIIRQLPADAVADVAFQEAVLATRAVPMPRPIRTVAGQVLVDVAGHQVRAYEWIDLLPMDKRLDPVVIGATLAAIHQVRHSPARPLIGWYTEPVGAPRWAQLLDEAKALMADFDADCLAADVDHLRHEIILSAGRGRENHLACAVSVAMGGRTMIGFGTARLI